MHISAPDLIMYFFFQLNIYYIFYILFADVEPFIIIIIIIIIIISCYFYDLYNS